jgi:hypothetical protein
VDMVINMIVCQMHGCHQRAITLISQDFDRGGRRGAVAALTERIPGKERCIHVKLRCIALRAYELARLHGPQWPQKKPVRVQHTPEPPRTTPLLPFGYIHVELASRQWPAVPTIWLTTSPLVGGPQMI